MAQGNLLEIILSKDVESKFEAIDKRLESIEKHTQQTVQAIGGLGATLVQEFGTINKGVDELTGSLNRLTVALSRMASTSQSSAGQTANTITTAAAQLNRLYSERLQYENKIAQLKTKRETQRIQGDPGAVQGLLVALDAYREKLRQTNDEIDKMAKKNAEAAKAAKQAYIPKHAEQSFNNEERRRIAIERTTEAMRRQAEAQQKLDQKKFNASLGITEKPQTIEQYRIAISNLKKEIDKLSPDDKKGIAALNKQIEQYRTKLGEAGVATQRFNQQANNLKATMQQLATAFGIGFSLKALIDYGRKVVQITGEFEMQHRALQAIIQDADKANQIWDKTVRLAVKSPYQVKELVTYTKQLAAYRIESDKLYDTTKMLADISAGLGVDMQRLILAYGQVKAANYLRGQELRQFSEAGVNILGELANYFTELQGRAVSTGEVFEMVSKRMVKFEDVATVLKRLTEEGGIFFQMQEIQAETLKGQIMNLRDSFDLMMNSVGESQSGVLTRFVALIKTLADNWRTVGNTLFWVAGLWTGINVIMKTHAIQLAAVKALQTGTTLSTTLLTRVMSLFDASVRKATASTHGFNAALKANPVGIVIGVLSALAGVIAALVGHMNKVRESQEKLNRIAMESAATTTKMVYQYKDMAEKIRDVNTSEEERNELMQKMRRMYGDILPERLLNIDYVTREGNAYGEASKAIAAYYQEQRRQRQVETVENEYGEEVDKAQGKAARSIQRYADGVYAVKLSLLDINAALSKLREEYDNGIVSIDNYVNELNKLLKMQTGISLDVGLKDNSGNNLFNLRRVERLLKREQEYVDAMDEATLNTRFGESLVKEVEEAFNSVNNGLGKLSGELDSKGTGIIQKAEKIARETANRFGKMWDSFRNSDAYKNNPGFFDNYYEVNIRPVIDNTAFDKQETEVKKKVGELIDEFNVTNTQGLDNALFDSSKHTLNEWYKDVLHPMVEMITAELRLADAGMSTQSDELIARYRGQIDMLKAEDEWIKKIIDGEKKTKGSGGNPALQLLNKQIDAIKNAAKQYEEYKKLYDDTKAFDKTKEAVEDLFGDLGIGGLLKKEGIFDKDTIGDNISTWLAGQMAKAGKDGKVAIDKYVRELGLQARQADFKEMVDGFKKGVDEAFADYDLYKELDKMGVGKDLASVLFGVDVSDMGELTSRLDALKVKLLSVYDGDEAQKAVEEMQKKVREAEDKAQKERLKKYVEYTKKAMTERAKIEVEGLRELADIEKSFQAEIAKARSAGDTARVTQLEQLMQKAVAGSKKATGEKLDKQAWEDFKSSDLYVELFDNIENASTNVVTAIQQRLTELRSSLKNLPADQLKAVMKDVQRLEDELIGRNPWKSYFKYYREVNELRRQGKTEDVLSARLVANENDIRSYEEMIAKNERLLELRREMTKAEIESEGGTAAWAEGNRLLEDNIAKWTELIQKKREDNKATQADLETYKRFRNASKSFADFLNNVGNRIGNIFSDIMSNLEAFGGETTEVTKSWGDMFSSIMSIIAAIPNYILLMKAAGVAANEALGVIGWIATGVELVVALVKGVANIRNARIDDEIEGYKVEVEKLAEAYERLEKSFDRAWDTTEAVQYRREMERNIREQTSYIDRQIEAEKRRKSPDDDAIRDWESQKRELLASIDELGDEFTEKMGGLGRDSYEDAAQGFVDAWYDAFKETGNGLEGLKENFDEIIENMVKKQAMRRITEGLLKPLFETIDSAVEDGALTSEEMSAVNTLASTTFPELNEKLRQFFESFGMFAGQAEGELSGLQQGIQGVTEQTAEIIAAYLNSIRFYVVDTNTKLGQLVGVALDETGGLNPMLNELRNLRMRTDDIYNFLWERRQDGSDAIRVAVVN